jgi:murein DD-endopeptidase MepM/ murein hydrolase activator NlpD
MPRSVGTAARRGRRATAYLVAAGLSAGAAVLPVAVSAAAEPTPAGTGGASQPAGSPAAGSPGAGSQGAGSPAAGSQPSSVPLGPVPFGVPRVKLAVVRGFRCLTGCADVRTPLIGGQLRIRGRNLRKTDLVVFLGAAGDADDVAAKPSQRRRTAVDVRVPLGAVAGPVTVADRNGMRPAPAPAPLGLAPQTASAPRTMVASEPQIEVQVADPRGFFDAVVPPHVTYVLHGTESAAVTVEVVRDADGTVVDSWAAGTVAPDTPQTASWNGTSAGRLQRAGRYSFRVSAQAPGAAQAVSSQASDTEPEPGAGSASGSGSGSGSDPASFVFLRHVFPVRGPHYYGEAGARFGGGRGHQGQDVLAACGTPLVAARGGRVQFRGYHSAAGNYLVIDGARTGIDYAYMHLRGAALVAQGQRVRTGQLLGYVGDTGDASACHLHFELWTAPGWYDGGAPYDPLASLQAWDKRS